jgi:MFS family permease
MFGSAFLGVLFFQHLLGMTSLETGFAFLPQTVMVAIMVMGPTARVARLLQPKLTALIGFAITTCGLVLFALATPSTPYFPQLCIALLLIGTGGAMTFTPLLTIAMANIPPADGGLGSGLINTSQQMAVALAIAALSVISSSRTKALLSAGSTVEHALAGGYRLGFIVGAASVASGVLVCALLVRNPEHLPPADLAPVVESIDI